MTPEDHAKYQATLDTIDRVLERLQAAGVETDEETTVTYTPNRETGTYRLNIKAEHVEILLSDV